MTTWCQIVLKFSFTIMKKMVQNTQCLSLKARSKSASSASSIRSDTAGMFLSQNPARIPQRMKASMRYGWLQNSSPHQALAAYNSLEMTTALWTVFKAASLMPWQRSTLSAWSIDAHEAITWRTWSLTDNLLVMVTPSILTDIND